MPTNYEREGHARTLLRRGLRKRCPHCGRGALFSAWYTLRDRCSECALPFEPSDGSTWAFMYITTAGITGIVIAVMLLLNAQGAWVWRLVVLPIAIAVIVASMPTRKGIAVAIEYYVDRSLERSEQPNEDASG